MTRFTGFRPSTARRGIAVAAFAALMFSGCSLTSGEATIAADTGAVAATTPEATTAPVFVEPTATAVPTPVTETAPSSGDSAAAPERGERSDASDATEVTPAPTPAPAETMAAPDTEESDTTSSTAEEPAADEAPTGEPPADEAPADESGEAAFNVVADPSCAEGVWESDPGQFGAYIDQVASLTGAGLTASGQITIALENGHYIYDIATLTSIDVDGFQTLSVVEGITQGNYEFRNGFVLAEQTFAEITAYIELPDGTRIDAGVLGDEFNQLAAFHEVPFDCTGPTTLTFHFDTQPGSLRYPMTFTRLR